MKASVAALPDKLGWAWKAFFWPASLLYGAAVRARTAAYRNGVLEVVRLPVPVICVGNLTVGGSGKTPGVIWLVEYLLKKGRRPAVITRGYGARGDGAVRVVSDGKGARLSAEKAGDEPFLLGRRLPNVPVVAGADRAAAGRRAVEEFGADVLVMDDGYQHLRLFRDLNLLCLDAREAGSLFKRGGACLLPAGRMREPLSALWRADVVFLTRAELPAPDRLAAARKRVETCLLDVPVVPVHGVLSFYEHATGAPREEGLLRGADVLALSGLARPEAFEEALRRRGMRVHPRRFPDHHFFSAGERAELLALARAQKREIVTTEKDAVRLPPDFPCLVARLDWSPAPSHVPEKGDTTPLPRTVPWTQRLDSVIS
jgi:tetraacyldisaccharide 4'-kinase